MIAVEFEEQNFQYGKPVGWDDAQCLPLNVWKGTAAGLIAVVTVMSLSQ